MEHDIYGITRWGDGLVGVLENGNVALNDPLSAESKPVDLAEVIHKLEQRGIQTPVLLRVSNFWSTVSKRSMRVLNMRSSRLIIKGITGEFFRLKLTSRLMWWKEFPNTARLFILVSR